MKLLRSTLDYLIIIFLTAVILIIVLQLWNSNLFTYPLDYGSGDTISVTAGTKAISENSIYSYSQDWGMPLGTSSYDFPNTSIFHNVVMKLIYLISGSWIFALNGYYLLGYFLVSIITLFVLKKLGISRSIAIVCALLYTFLPYHFMRGISHLTLGAYYMIPLAVWFALRFMRGEKLFTKNKGRIINLNNILTLAVLLIIGTYWVYYAFFTCFFFGVALIYRILNKKNIKRIWEIIVSIVFIVISLVLIMVPNLIYWHNNGHNLEAVTRHGYEIERYAIKISQLILPIPNHRISTLSNLTSTYNQYPLTSENTSSALGLVMAIGFILLLGCIFVLNKLKDKNLKSLTVMNISAILLATIGGFSSIMSLVITDIRCFNRISVFIAMFSICCIAIILDKIRKQFFKKGIKRLVFMIVLLICLVGGIFDQTTEAYVPDYENIKAAYNIDKDFVQQIESVEVDGAMIYQMPYVAFPEAGLINRMGDYSHFLPYIHSTKLKWSYAAMKGRAEDAWLERTSEQPLEEMLETISLAGFEGIYIDRYGYKEEKVIELEKKLKKLLNTEPIVSGDERKVYYNLDNYNNKLQNKYKQEEYDTLKENVLHPVLDMWSTGFYEKEGENNNTFRWSGQESELYLWNLSDDIKTVEVKFDLDTPYDSVYPLKIESDSFTDQMEISYIETHYTKTIEVNPGEPYKISFNCGAPYLSKGEDQRNLSFRIMNFTITE